MARGVGDRQLSPTQIKKIVELSQEGNSNRTEIAQEVGCSKPTVWKYQRAYNLI